MNPEMTPAEGNEASAGELPQGRFRRGRFAASRRGFTLVEMLVTTTMLALIVGAGTAVFSAGTRSAAKAKRYDAIVAQGQRALQRICRDLRAAARQEGFSLTALDVQQEGHDCDTLDLIVARPNPERKLPDEGAWAEVGYSLAKNSTDGKRAKAAGEIRGLLRREDPTLDDDPLEGGTMHLVAPLVSDLNFEFYDGLSWKAGWDDATALPRAVHIQVTAEDEEGIENPMLFSTTIWLMAQ
jgi:type II secretion system protein J